MSDNLENTHEEEDVRTAHLLTFILAGTDLLRYEVLDKDEIDRQEIVTLADNIEKHTMELAQIVLGANIDEWKAELERKRNRE